MSRPRFSIATVIFLGLLWGFWTQIQTAGIVANLGGHIGSAFACFALLLAPLWYGGFSRPAGGWWFDRLPLSNSEDTEKERERGENPHSTKRRLNGAPTRVLLPVALAIPYVVFAVPRGEFRWIYFAGLALLPVALAAVLSTIAPSPEDGVDAAPDADRLKFTWQDCVVLLTIAVVLETRVFSGAWPYNGLGSLPKLYLADVSLYLYLVVRRLEGIGYSFVPDLNDAKIGLREWLFFLPLALGLGFATHFIRFYARVPSAGHVIGAFLVIFLLTAVPEELFFRGILQNLLAARVGRTKALIVTACLFGLSHFHKGATFNWRYVILASIAGIFYGRAWRARRHLFASSLTHTLVDVVWGLWFR